jgi:hypothetical protein
MAPTLFQMLFLLALTVPALAVAVGVAWLFLPAPRDRSATRRAHRAAAHA